MNVGIGFALAGGFCLPTFAIKQEMDIAIQNRALLGADDCTGGIVYFARMIQKIRLHAAGALRSDFHANPRVPAELDLFKCTISIAP
jgi:hypothetical protein